MLMQAPPAWCSCYTNTICMDMPIRKAHGLRARTTATDHARGPQLRDTDHGALPCSTAAGHGAPWLVMITQLDSEMQMRSGISEAL